MKPIPDELRSGPFTRQAAKSAGVSSRMLQGKRFVRIFPGVWRCADHAMTEADWVRAATLALPDDAYLTGITLIQQLGCDFGPKRPMRFVVERDHHLKFDEIFLHRTEELPPTDGRCVSVAAAFIAYCATARVIDAIKVGDWLLRNRHTTISEIRDLALSGLWRAGAHEAVWVLDHLDPRSRSLKESETRSVLEFAGLPVPESNVTLPIGDDVVVVGDLVYKRWKTVVEYEGSQHQESRDQYVYDIDRYAIYRAHGIRYVQATKEKLDHARTLVGEVYRELLRAGYDGPPPEFGERWKLLFRQCSVAVGPRKDRVRAGAERKRVASRGPKSRAAVS